MIRTHYNAFYYLSSSYDNDNDEIALQRVADFFGPRDIGRCECVCTLWRAFCQNQELWRRLSLREGVPLVAGEDRDRRADFQALYPITISGARISRTIGEVEGKIPLISNVLMNVLKEPDPFEEEKLMKDTWVFVVDPAQIKRTAGVLTPLAWDGNGNLVKVPDNQVQNGKELVIPLSLKNLRLLCSYPLEGRENMPVFSNYCYDEVFNRCGASSDKTRVYFMRRCIVEKSRNLTYAKQKELVGRFGITCVHTFGITPIRIRALFDAIAILKSGTCPDANETTARSYARCSDIVYHGKEAYHTDIGNFASLYGADVDSRNYPHIGIGVAPCISAEFLQ